MQLLQDQTKPKATALDAIPVKKLTVGSISQTVTEPNYISAWLSSAAWIRCLIYFHLFIFDDPFVRNQAVRTAPVIKISREANVS